MRLSFASLGAEPGARFLDEVKLAEQIKKLLGEKAG